MNRTTIPAALLEKAALDNGFDRELGAGAGWVRFDSTHAPLSIWLATNDEGPLVALSRGDVAYALAEHGLTSSVALPPGAVAARVVADVPALHRLLRRAYQLARTLPNGLLHAFQQKTAELPRTTEAQRLVVQRVGQDLFRAGLVEYWEGRCAVTGVAIPELLRASHIKPWAVCETDAERLDVFNGLLLAANYDAAFDAGLVTFDDDGRLVRSRQVSAVDLRSMGIVEDARVARLTAEHQRFLAWHREHEFRNE
ncbi:HNH endonuclease [Anaeromyxobacter sp. SG66]|uniref:HNH endonuclease n=1 Tax=Anaeromyxobacter sp. SG66 TaxID=2925410 RepID=UPI001F56ED32|nr:HNH endonuclease [Anaeromyxobacter sp. SG66]